MLQKTFSSIEGLAEEGANLLGIATSNDPDSIVAAINQFVFAWQGGKRPSKKVVDPDDVPYLLGALWGQQLVRKFGWEWRMVTFHEHGDSIAPGVLSPDRSFAIYPIHFIIGCLQDPTVDATILASFNMLKDGDTGGVASGEYFNYMEGVHRIVPRICPSAEKSSRKR